MALTVSTNDGSLDARRNFLRSTKKLGKTFERLPSGLGLQRSTDDSVGVSLTTGLAARVRDANGAIRSTNDAISSVQVAEDALVETFCALHKIRDLANHGGKNALVVETRAAMQKEINRIINEIQRISLQTQFNDQKVVNGSFTRKKFQIGADGKQSLVVTIQATSVVALGINSANVKVYSTEGTTAQMQSMANGLVARVDSALDSISDIRANLGIYQNRFSNIISNLSSIEANTKLAQSHIHDADMANETASLTRNTILLHADMGISAQANQQPQIAMQLLG
ncbi:MAG: flagellin FliC [Magnetococcales bacterium]|nr:flagellin FliC [Magnetococcales bacterium]